MASPPPPPQQLAALRQPSLPSRYRSFAQYYSEVDVDSERILQRFDPDGPNVIQGPVLLDQVLNSGLTPQAYLCVSATRRGPRIYCLHLPSRYPSSLDGRTTPWDNNLYAYLGDVVQGQITIVAFPSTGFNIVEDVEARTEGYILEHLNELNGLDVFPPIMPNDPYTAGVSTRYLMYLPLRYAPLMLDASGYTIRQAWERLYPALLETNALDKCTALLSWLHVASSSVNSNQPGLLGPPVTAVSLFSPPVDRDLILHRSALLNRVLPGLNQPSEGLESALYQMAAAVVTQTNDLRQAREQRDALTNEPKLPSDKFSVTLPLLLEYTEIQDERDLPLLWHQWANCTKQQEFNILRDVLEAYTRTPDAFSSLPPWFQLN
jgi:hypothetical protein